MTQQQVVSSEVSADRVQATASREIVMPIQYARGVAALMVVLFHNEYIVKKYFGDYALGRFFEAGHSGVEFFFVLSGYIIYRMHSMDMGHPDRAHGFYVKRAVRILPLYWLVMVPFGLLMLLVPSVGADRALTLWDFVRDALLIPRDGAIVVSTAWTLHHEVIFYAMFGLMILNARVGIAAFIMWQASCVAALLFGLLPDDSQAPLGKFFGVHNFGFLVGISIGILAERVNLRAHAGVANLAVATAFALMCGMIWSEFRGGKVAHPAAMTLIYLALYAVIMVWLLSLSQRSRPLADRLLGRLGAASYALYICHLAVASIVVKVLVVVGAVPHTSPLVAYLLTVCAAVVAALALHMLVEQPLLRHGRRLLLAR